MLSDVLWHYITKSRTRLDGGFRLYNSQQPEPIHVRRTDLPSIVRRARRAEVSPPQAHTI